MVINMQLILQDVNFGANLRRLRLASKLTQEQVSQKAQLLGSQMSRETYSHIENGDRNIKASDLIILKQVFNTTYEDILETVNIVP